MTKSLTEKWKNGELDGGYYYLIMEDETLRIDHTEYKFWNKTICWEHLDEHFVKEVLAPVPSYEEWQSYEKCADMLIDVNKKWYKTIVENKKLKKKLEIATKALEKYQEAINRFKKDPMNNIIMLAHQLIYDIDTDSKKALREMEGVK
ncbi:MAG: hypothetical protein J6S85_05815 [Methanobrevibacter sp.]|nr:hypothetical protein [Methanobrevibacter sp.]